MNRRLYRCRENRIIAGVASGVAEYFGLDPTLVRILWFVSIFFGGLGIVAYIGLAIIVPIEPLTPELAAAHAAAAEAGTQGHRHAAGGTGGRLAMLFGIVLIVVGSFGLLEMLLPGWMSWRQLFPLLLIVIGGFIVASGLRREPEEHRETTEV